MKWRQKHFERKCLDAENEQMKVCTVALMTAGVPHHPFCGRDPTTKFHQHHKGFYSLTRQHGKYALVCLIQPWISSMEASLSASFMEIKRFSIEGFLSEIFRCYDEKNSTTLQWGAKHVRVRAKKICECGVVIEPSKTRADWRKPTS